MNAPVVAVVGAGEADLDQDAAAEAVGTALARAGATLVCGGLGGVMAAACRGARRAGGTTVGLLPGDDRRAANEWIGIAIATGLGEGRNLLVVRSADAVIAIGGAFGTLSEIAFARKLGRPVVGLGTWSAISPSDSGALVHVASDPETAVDMALRMAVLADSAEDG